MIHQSNINWMCNGSKTVNIIDDGIGETSSNFGLNNYLFMSNVRKGKQGELTNLTLRRKNT